MPRHKWRGQRRNLEDYIIPKERYIDFDQQHGLTIHRQQRRVWKMLFNRLLALGFVAGLVAMGQIVAAIVVTAALVFVLYALSSWGVRQTAGRDYEKSREVFEQPAHVEVDGDTLTFSKGGEQRRLDVSGVERIEEGGGLYFINHNSGFYYWFPKDAISEEELRWFEEPKRYGMSVTIPAAGGNDREKAET